MDKASRKPGKAHDCPIDLYHKGTGSIHFGPSSLTNVWSFSFSDSGAEAERKVLPTLYTKHERNFKDWFLLYISGDVGHECQILD